MEYRVSHFPMLSRFFLTANEKDFSLALEMTVWESGILALLPFPRRKGFVCRHCPKQVILLLIRNKKRALPSGDALFDLLCLSKVLVSNAQDRSIGQVPPNLYPYTSSASSRIRARLFSQPRQGSVMDLP